MHGHVVDERCNAIVLTRVPYSCARRASVSRLVSVYFRTSTVQNAGLCLCVSGNTLVR